MRAWIFYGPGDLRLEEIESPDPGPGEIKIKVMASATCGTDLKTYRRGHPTIPVTPSRFGHEAAGIVMAVGRGVKKFSEGDRVVCANTVPCGSCWACTIHRPSLCENLTYLYGSHAEELIVPEGITSRNTYKIPENLSFEAASPLEPLSTVVHGIYESGIKLGDTVVVNGAGPIGQMFVRLATVRGAHVISVDQTDWRLERAKEAGAEVTLNVAEFESTEDKAAEIRRHTPEGRGADVAIEAVGLPAVWEQTWQSLRPGGTALMFGGTPKDAPFSVNSSAMHYKEYVIKGCFHHTPQYVKVAVDMLASGIIDGQGLITESRPLERLIDSLEDMAQGKGSKYAIVPTMSS